MRPGSGHARSPSTRCPFASDGLHPGQCRVARRLIQTLAVDGAGGAARRSGGAATAAPVAIARWPTGARRGGRSGTSAVRRTVLVHDSTTPTSAAGPAAAAVPRPAAAADRQRWRLRVNQRAAERVQRAAGVGDVVAQHGLAALNGTPERVTFWAAAPATWRPAASWSSARCSDPVVRQPLGSSLHPHCQQLPRLRIDKRRVRAQQQRPRGGGSDQEPAPGLALGGRRSQNGSTAGW